MEEEGGSSGGPGAVQLCSSIIEALCSQWAWTAHIPEVAEAAADVQSSLPLRLESSGPPQGTDGTLKLGIGGELSKATVYRGRARVRGGVTVLVAWGYQGTLSGPAP